MPERYPGAPELPRINRNEPPALTGSSNGTAGCGPAFPVVWEERSRDDPAWPDPKRRVGDGSSDASACVVEDL